MALLCLCLVMCLFHQTQSQPCNAPPCDLIETVLGSYKKEMRPRCENASNVDVHMEMALRQVVTLSETKQILTSNAWIRLKWNDCRLRWNPAHFNGTDAIHVSYDRIWTPDVTLYDDTASGNNVALSERKFYNLAVTSEGNVSQFFPTILRSICSVDTTYFPFDLQQCPLEFGLWVYDDSMVTLSSTEQGDVASYQENAEWFLTGVSAVTNPNIYTNSVYTTIIYTVNIRRRPLFFLLTLFFPCCLICSISAVGFFLPPASGEKIGLEVTVFLSVTLFQFITLERLPPNSKPLPIICVYFMLVMIWASTSCFLAVVVLRVHLKGQQGWKVPPMVRSIFIDRLGRILCVKRPHKFREYADKHLNKMNPKANGTNAVIPFVSEEAPTSPTEFGAILKSYQKISESLDHLVKHTKDKKPDPDSVDLEYDDWLTVAIILDRLFFLLHVALFLVVLIVFLVELSN
ncbi:neuronal acetylcholine receptor subunit beta-3-like isoform X1 [Haliotis cracherodii]|uniref:neuronal acetylcholine receptor subunit beta-3-like isoform X1 n=1 Tax=Haliotis cracherodii TaxID=6455 RepID=UPI0039EC1D18